MGGALSIGSQAVFPGGAALDPAPDAVDVLGGKPGLPGRHLPADQLFHDQASIGAPGHDGRARLPALEQGRRRLQVQLALPGFLAVAHQAILGKNGQNVRLEGGQLASISSGRSAGQRQSGEEDSGKDEPRMDTNEHE